EREARRLAEEQARREKEKRERAEKARLEAKRKEAERKAKDRERKPSNEKVKPETKPAKSQSGKEDKYIAEAPVMTKENFNLSSNFASNKGKLPIPVTGRYRIIGRFGTHRHGQWNVTTNSSGIDIQAQSGAQARAVFNGEVSRVVAFPGYNNCVIIRHGGYYTFYGNIQQVNVRQGQKVSAGQPLGVIYTDADTGSSQLHFQLWKGTNKLNPEPWLQR
ncbi:peptidoglycan DD-metalloendopeptidase family protein, partial [Dysgonomonas sp. OttesenSCG-928-M03]|nr:peptidoglycan DD-metalloendopeptidase family protein [Dysgonomonas sp. OttesenSCG-928-M03]